MKEINPNKSLLCLFGEAFASLHATACAFMLFAAVAKDDDDACSAMA